MNIYIEIAKVLVSGLLATIVTLIVAENQRKRNAKYEYKLAVFREAIAYRTDIARGAVPTGNFQKAINQVFVAYNDCREVLVAFEDFRKAATYMVNPDIENEKVISLLLVLFKAMAKELKIDYSFSNDDLFTKPLTIGSKTK